MPDPEPDHSQIERSGCSLRSAPELTPTSDELNAGTLMQGKRGLIMGVANDHSIAWGIAKTLAAHGAELAFTYQGEALGRAREAAGGIGRLEDRAAVRRRGHRLGRRGVRRDREAMGHARFPRPRHRASPTRTN